MIDAKCKVKFNPNALVKPVRKGGNQALKKAAAYVCGVARRKVKRRKHKNSAPGQPPFAHTGIFKASILYAVDPANIASYVGPQRLQTYRTNAAGQPVPEILEFGGMAALGMNANWIHKRAPRGTNSIEGIAAYFKGLGKGPIAWGTSPAQADAKVGRGYEAASSSGRESSKTGKMKFKVHPKRYSPVLRKKVYLAYVRIHTDAQARKVARTVVDVFGYPATNRPVKIAPRPLMGPSLEDSKSFIAQCFRNSIQP
jgi:hypothetical protein